MKKLFIHDVKEIFSDKKTVILISFLEILTFIICLSFCLLIQSDNESMFNQLKTISEIEDQNLFISFFINIFSFLFFTTFPFILGIAIISYLKEFGTLELMMLFPINRKTFFIEKIFCIFIISLLLSWLSIFLNSFIQFSILHSSISFSKYKLIYTFIVLPVWLFFISCITIIISSCSKDSKEANQRSLLLPFILTMGMQLFLYLKINIFSYKVINIPFLVGALGSIIILLVLRKKINLEAILYK